MTDIAIPDAAPPMLPQAAAGLVEWAQAAKAAHQLATALCATSFVPKQYAGKPGEATAAILAGSELGFSPLASLRAFDNIQGTTAPKAITLRAVAQSKGHHLEIVEESDTRAVAEYKRKGDTGPMRTVEWTIEQANKMGLPGKNPNWKSQPRAMLVARATAEAARRVASDAILGVPYAAEELQDSATSVAPVSAPSERTDRLRAAIAPVAAPEPAPLVEDPPEDDGWPTPAPIPGVDQ